MKRNKGYHHQRRTKVFELEKGGSFREVLGQFPAMTRHSKDTLVQYTLSKGLVPSLGHLGLDRGGGGSRSSCTVGGRRPRESLRVQRSRGIAEVDFASILAQCKAIDAWNGAGDAVSVLALILEELGGHGEVVSVSHRVSGGSSHKSAGANAAVKVEFKAMVYHISTVDTLSDLAVENAGQAVANNRCRKNGIDWEC